MNNRHTVRNPHGNALWTDPDSGTVEKDTLQCVHCEAHWNVEPGSGRKRGWCVNCAGPHCGAEACHTCTPFEMKLAQWDKEAAAKAAFAKELGLQE